MVQIFSLVHVEDRMVHIHSLKYSSMAVLDLVRVEARMVHSHGLEQTIMVVLDVYN